MSENESTKSLQVEYAPYLDIDMRYPHTLSNIERGRNKLRFALQNAARFGFVSTLTSDLVKPALDCCSLTVQAPETSSPMMAFLLLNSRR